MKTVNVHEAKSTLSALLGQIERGEEITIARNGKPVAKLVRVTPSRERQPGLLREHPAWQAFTYEPSLFAAMSDAELADEGWL